MGFIAIAAFASMIVSYPVNGLFWDGQGPAMLARAALLLIIGGCITYLLSQSAPRSACRRSCARC